MRISDWSSDVCSSDLLDLMCQAVFDFDIGARPKVERDQFGGTFAKALCQIFAADDEIPALLVLPPNDDVGVGMARVEMIDRDPVELRAQVLLHLRRSAERRVGKGCVSTCRYRR